MSVSVVGSCLHLFCVHTLMHVILAKYTNFRVIYDKINHFLSYIRYVCIIISYLGSFASTYHVRLVTYTHNT